MLLDIPLGLLPKLKLNLQKPRNVIICLILALIVCFNVRNSKAIEKSLEKFKVPLIKNNIIYRLIEQVIERMVKLIPPVYEDNIRGRASIAAVFEISVNYGDKTEKVAGSKVELGMMEKGDKDLTFVRVLRQNKEIFRGKIKMMKHFKKEVSSVNKGMECGIVFQDFRDFQIGDIIEYAEKTEVKQSL